jgi:hypothetical protein
MALRINAIGKRLERTTNLPAPPYTFMCWFKYNADSATDKKPVFYLGDLTSDDFIAFEGSYDVDFYLRRDVATVDQESLNVGSIPTTDLWYWCAMGIGSTLTPTHYPWDGTITPVGSSITWTSEDGNSAGMDGTLPAAELMAVGGTNGVSAPALGWVNGRILALKIWSARLTTAEMAAERFYYNPQVTSNVHAWYPLQTESSDHSANAYNFTEVGTVAWEVDEPAGMNPLGGGVHQRMAFELR